MKTKRVSKSRIDAVTVLVLSNLDDYPSVDFVATYPKEGYENARRLFKERIRKLCPHLLGDEHFEDAETEGCFEYEGTKILFIHSFKKVI